MISIILKVSALLLVAAVVQAVVHRRASAAMRHFVWTMAVVSVLLLPMFSVALPEWTWITTAPTDDARHAIAAGSLDDSHEVVRTASPAGEAAPSRERAARAINDVVMQPPVDRAQSTSWPAVAFRIYILGLILMLAGLLVQQSAVRRLARRASDVCDGDWTLLFKTCVASLGIRRPVRLLRSREHSMPMAIGSRRPAIVIPSTADTWSEDRRRAVLLHELAHVARYDCLTQAVAFVACTVYWFHPGVWWVARRLRIERELACDDRVIAAGTGARDYAEHLLEIAYSLGRHRAPVLAVSMARPRQLEGRILAALDSGRNRTTPRLNVSIATIAAAACLVMPLAAATSGVVAAEAAPTTVSSPASRQDAKIGPSLKSWDTLIFEFENRILREAMAAMGVPQDRLPGTWEIRPTSSEGTVHLRLVELNSSSGSDVQIDQLQGLTGAQLKGAGGPVQFRLQRDGGTFTFEGVIRSGVGAGTFSFAPDPNFAAEMARRGFARPSASEQYQMARNDVGFAFIDELNKHGYAKPETSELVRAGQHGVRAAYLRDMAALGYRLGSLAPLIELRDHGVGPTYVRELADQGYKGLAADELRRARDHGISPEYVRAMRDNGYGSLKMDELINARDHGVSGEYASDMRRLGYTVALDDLIRARDHGVSVEFVGEITALGYDKLPLDTLVRLRDHGVSAKYVQELKGLGYERLSVDDLVTLRDHGLSAERIRTANSRAGTRLPVDMLKSFAAGGLR